MVGAGASAEFELPIGRGLADGIRTALDTEFRSGQNPGPIIQALMRAPGGFTGDHHIAANDLRGGLLNSRSIDHLLYTRRARPLVVELGKLGIAAQLVAGERGSGLSRCEVSHWDRTQNVLLQYRESWLAHLFYHVVGDRSPEEMIDAFADINFITFNYDRCIEQYLFHALHVICGLPTPMCRSVVEAIPILHVYGDLGAFDFGEGHERTAFGADPQHIAYVASRIRTYTEGAASGLLERVQQTTAEAERVVFLGFGYDPTNVALLFPNGRSEDQEVWGTTSGVNPDRKSDFNRAVYGSGYTNAYEWRFPALKCGQFLDAHGHQVLA